MKRRTFKRAAGFCVLALFAAAILFSEYLVSVASPAWLRSIAIEVRAACRDPGTQWMVFLCAGIYFITFTILGQRGARSSTTKHTNDTKGGTESILENFQPSTFNLQPADWWLCGLLLIAALHYAFNYATASGSTQALMLMVGAAIGKGARLWAGWGSADKGKHSTFNAQPSTSKQSEGVNELPGEWVNEQGSEATANRKSEIVNRKFNAPTPDPSPEGNWDEAAGGKAESGNSITTKHTNHTKGGSGEELELGKLQLASSSDSQNLPQGLHSPAKHSPADVPVPNFQPGARVRLLLTVLLLLLGMAALWHPEGAMQFQYRGLNRWSGPWDNPNIFGLLMGVGVVVGAGLLVASCMLKVAGSAAWRCWLWRVMLMMAAGCCAVGLLKSYSRGAWLGTALGLAVLALRFIVVRPRSRPSSSNFGSLSCSSWLSWLRFNWLPLSVLLASILALCFWQFRHTEFHPVRRAFSVGNPNDFSWRNRVAAWEGALAMMADKPVTGFGWNKPERIYDQFYRPAKVSEGMAIQLNHYFILGMSLGLPALICFAMYAGLCVVPLLGGVRGGFGGSTIYDGRFTIGRSLRSMFDVSLPLICLSAAVVLLVGLWFDGGLFNLATASLFWVLLELGRGTALPACRGEEEEPDKSANYP